MAMKKMRKLIVTGIVSLLVFISLQAVFFHLLCHESNDLIEEADAVVVFAGTFLRSIKGIELVKAGVAPALIVSPATAGQIDTYRRQYALPETVRVILETQASTTYENAYYTTRVLQQNHIRSMVLVTSDYHMPRSYLLLRLAAAGRGIRVQRAALDHPAPGTTAWAKKWWKEKRLFNEMVEFWGSLFEFGYHRVTGKMVAHGLRHCKTITFLEKHLSVD
jgi:uncharacterized SAM-binding protein YcdF (DUF218 family)